jgi:tetratricopeptide (TPR) repeat protein
MELGESLANAGADVLAVRAEEQRRAGDPEAALRFAQQASARDPESPAARAAAALALLDLGRDAEARRFLAMLIHGGDDEPAVTEAAADELDALDDGEVERAFEDASPEPEAMRDANEVAFEAMREAQLLAPEADPASPFRTRTMASLLERQGDRVAARAIRASLAPRDEVAAPRRGRRKDDVLGTLERWLGRLRRGDA